MTRVTKKTDRIGGVVEHRGGGHTMCEDYGGRGVVVVRYRRHWRIRVWPDARDNPSRPPRRSTTGDLAAVRHSDNPYVRYLPPPSPPPSTETTPWPQRVQCFHGDPLAPWRRVSDQPLAAAGTNRVMVESYLPPRLYRDIFLPEVHYAFPGKTLSTSDGMLEGKS